MTAEDDIRAEFAKLENLERRQAALRGLAAQLTPLRSHLEPDRLAELAALNPGHDQKQLTRLAILADINDACPDCQGTGVIEGNSCTCEYPYAVQDAGHHPSCGLIPCPRGCEPKEAAQ